MMMPALISLVLTWPNVWHEHVHNMSMYFMQSFQQMNGVVIVLSGIFFHCCLWMCLYYEMLQYFVVLLSVLHCLMRYFSRYPNQAKGSITKPEVKKRKKERICFVHDLHIWCTWFAYLVSSHVKESDYWLPLRDLFSFSCSWIWEPSSWRHTCIPNYSPCSAFFLCTCCIVLFTHSLFIHWGCLCLCLWTAVCFRLMCPHPFSSSELLTTWNMPYTG